MTKSILISEIERFDFVSFDLYDTLIFRTVNLPSDVWRLTEAVFNRKQESKIRFFKEKRSLAEKIARKKKMEGKCRLMIYIVTYLLMKA